MGKIICDTNVWYRVAQGNIPSFFNSDMPIYATHTNIDELSVTRRLTMEFDLVQKTFISIFTYYHELIIRNPVDYLIEKNDSSHQSRFSPNYIEILGLSEEIANQNLVQDYFEDEHVKNQIQARKEELKTNAKTFTRRFKFVKAVVDKKIRENLITEAEIWAGDISGFAKHVAKDLIKSISLGYDVSSQFDWNQVELFIKILERLSKDLLLTDKTFKANDWYDLTNLIYVEPGDKYYTYDNYWLNLIMDSGMGHYLAQ